MNVSSAVILLDQHSDPRYDKPLMLRDLLFCPALVWLFRALQDAGVVRFLVFAPEAHLSAVAALSPEGTVAADAASPDADALLRTFAREAEGDVICVTRPVWLSLAGAQTLAESDILPAGGPDVGIFRVPGRELSSAAELDRGAPFLPPEEEWPMAFPVSDADELAMAEYLARFDMLDKWMSAGVRILSPDSTFLDPTVTLAPGVTLLPGTILRGNTRIGAGCEIGPNAMLTDTAVGENTVINASQLNQATVGSGTTVGPFAYVRPNSHIGDGVKVGDFVEVKNSVIGNGTKIPHLTYVGDSDVGDRVNFGCGSITVNYDGNSKHRTTVGDNCFIGCNTNLVAPVTLGPGAFTAAGTTVTEDIPADALAVARCRQTVKPGWAGAHRKKK